MPPTQSTNLNKKHLARVERERIARRNLMLIAVAFIVVIVGIIIYGYYATQILPPLRPVAKIGNETISTKAFQDRVRFERNRLVNQYVNVYQYAQSLKDNPDMANYFKQNLQQIQTQLVPASMGETVMAQMIQDVLVRQEAARRGYTASEDEITKRIQEDFGYSESGPTPTPTLFPTLGPTSTKSSQQLTLVPDYTHTPTSTPLVTATVTLTPPPTLIPSPTVEPSITPSATPYTLDMYNAQYKDTLDRLKTDIQFDEIGLRELIKTDILRKKLFAAIKAELPITQDEVWARHILVADEETAKKVVEELKANPDWKTLAAKYSIDPGSKDSGGDVGWFGKGMMVPEFEEAVFKMAIGDISSPIKTQYGWHIIQVLGHETRPVSSYEFQQITEKEFAKFIGKLKEETIVETYDETWKGSIPEIPAIPAGIETFADETPIATVQP